HANSTTRQEPAVQPDSALQEHRALGKRHARYAVVEPPVAQIENDIAARPERLCGPSMGGGWCLNEGDADPGHATFGNRAAFDACGACLAGFDEPDHNLRTLRRLEAIDARARGAQIHDPCIALPSPGSATHRHRN